MRKSLFLKTLMTVLVLNLMLGSGLAMAQPPAGGRMGGFFTPRQRAIWMQQARDKTQSMSDDEIKVWRRDQFAKLAAMSDTDKAKFKAGLQAQWDALPQTQKDQIEQRIASRKQDGGPAKGKPLNLDPNQGQAVVQ
ncbi:MAG TPA: hypothetical protein VGM26_16640 [Rhizomicrobium sp.]|jgi:hypothetical protein